MSPVKNKERIHSVVHSPPTHPSTTYPPSLVTTPDKQTKFSVHMPTIYNKTIIINNIKKEMNTKQQFKSKKIDKEKYGGMIVKSIVPFRVHK